MKIKFILIILAFAFYQGCSKGSETSQSSQAAGSPPASVASALAEIQLATPDSNRGKITLDVKNMDNLKSIVLTVDGKDSGKITRLPNELYFDGTVNPKPEIVVRAVAINIDGSEEVVEKIIKNVNSEEPGSSPISDPSCFTNPAYDACLFYKNPVAQMKGPLAAKLSYGADLTAVQVFGVKLRNLTNPTVLRNTSINVSASSGVRAVPVNGKWNFAYKDDTSKHAVSQVMAFYWLNEQIEYMRLNSGIFYAENKAITVDAFSSAVNNNAYWDGSRIVMGNFGTQELALSSEVYLHEMGHANLDYATNGQITISSNRCATKFGCIGAIHEGMADIHANLLFPLDPTMAQTVTNSLGGWPERDPRNFFNRNLDYFYTTLSGNGEVHGMGTAYSTILYQIFKDAAMNPREFEVMFSMHLPRLTSSSDFRSAKAIWMNISDTKYAGKYTVIIKGYFEKMGVL